MRKEESLQKVKVKKRCLQHGQFAKWSALRKLTFSLHKVIHSFPLFLTPLFLSLVSLKLGHKKEPTFAQQKADDSSGVESFFLTFYLTSISKIGRVDWTLKRMLMVSASSASHFVSGPK